MTLPQDDPDGWFGAEVAADYDDPDSDMFSATTIDPVVDVLAGLAGNRPALEFAIGTGRIALPLAQRGVEVHGIELSRAMVDRLRAKPGGADIPVTIGDMAHTRVDGEFGVVFLVFNTISNLTSQQDQVDCFRNAAAHLAPGGCFVIENGVPSLRNLPPGQEAVPFLISPERVGFDTYRPATQQMVSHHIILTGERPEYRAVPFRYVWPSELDLMAQLAGMRLRNRWQDWTGTPFTDDSTRHVSIWEKVS
jgi:SAM-dependent methyltransferase